MSMFQRQAMTVLALLIETAQQVTRRADDLVQSDTLHGIVDPELRGHISIALQHLQMAEQMLHEEVKGE